MCHPYPNHTGNERKCPLAELTDRMLHAHFEPEK